MKSLLSSDGEKYQVLFEYGYVRIYQGADFIGTWWLEKADMEKAVKAETYEELLLVLNEGVQSLI